MYNYKIVNYWNDLNDLYVNYIVENIETNSKANVIEFYNTSDISCDYRTSSEEEIKDSLLELIKQNKGLEFNLPRVSELSSLLTYVYDTVCESESNMCHISEEDWIELIEEYDFTDQDIEPLVEEIKKYDICDYITVNYDGYKICGYGGLQCCFNDDRMERNDNFER